MVTSFSVLNRMSEPNETGRSSPSRVRVSLELAAHQAGEEPVQFHEFLV